MYKEVLRTIAGIEVFPVVSLVIFVTVFVVMLVWVMRLDRHVLSACANLPLEGDPTPTPTPSPSPGLRPDARRGAQL